MISAQYRMLGNTSSRIKSMAPDRYRGPLPLRQLLVAEGLAARAMDMMKAYRRDIGKDGAVEEKEPNTWLTKADVDIQNMQIEEISVAFPEVRFIAEEKPSDSHQGLIARTMNGGVWTLDPIDGTVSFARKLANRYGKAQFLFKDFVQFGMQGSYLENGIPKYAIFAAPELDIDGSGYSVFEAVSGLPGAFLNGKPVSFPSRTVLRDSFAIISLAGHRMEDDIRKVITKRAGLARVQKRNVCSGSEFCTLIKAPKANLRNYTGEYSLFVTEEPKPWDLLPGAYLIEKSGGAVRYLDGMPIFPFSLDRLNDQGRAGNVVAGSRGNVELVTEIISAAGV